MIERCRRIAFQCHPVMPTTRRRCRVVLPFARDVQLLLWIQLLLLLPVITPRYVFSGPAAAAAAAEAAAASSSAFALPSLSGSGYSSDSRRTKSSHRLQAWEFRASSSTRNAVDGGSGSAKKGEEEKDKEEDNAAMKFLKKVGRVGGAANRDFRFAMGVDEGSTGKSFGSSSSTSSAAAWTMASSSSSSFPLRKSRNAYPSCVSGGGIIDNMLEAFPTTAIGTDWTGYTDQVMGGRSMAVLVRDLDYEGRVANVLRGQVRTLPTAYREGYDESQSAPAPAGFVQMGTNLNHPSESSTYVDATSFDGVEVDVACRSHDGAEEETFNVHLKNLACLRPFSSYRATFRIPGNAVWMTVRIPWKQFSGHGPGAADRPFDPSQLVRIGIVAIGRPMKVELAVAGLRFYRAQSA